MSVSSRTQPIRSAAAPCNWKLFFAKSIPIMLTISMDAPSFQGSVKVDATMAHCDAVGQGASIPSLKDAIRRKCEGKTNWEKLRRKEATGIEPEKNPDEGEFDWS